MKGAGRLQLAANLALWLFLAIMLATNGVAEDQGPITWFSFFRLPDGSGRWIRIGPVVLLPLAGVACWLVSRRKAAAVPRWEWGFPGITLPLAALGALALLSLGWQCVQQACNLTAVFRLLLLLALFWWVYLFILNERPNLLWAVVTLVIIIVLQSLVAIGQFLLQHDLGLQLLGEWELNPAETGISVVMNNGRRWLRSYGLTRHPNMLGQTLVLCMLLLLALVPPKLAPQPPAADQRQKCGGRPWAVGRLLMPAVFLLALAGVFVTLSRWAWACLALGLFLFALPTIRSFMRERRLPVISRSIYRAMPIVLFVLGVGGVLYGSAVVGRFFHLNDPIESRSLWERERDIAISLALIRQYPWTGVGFGNYLAQAVRMDWWAEPVHSVPLHFGAELGMLGVAIWLLFLVAPLLSTNVWRSRIACKGPPAINVLLAFWMLGLLQPGPNPLIEVRSALLAGLVLSICPCIFSRV